LQDFRSFDPAFDTHFEYLLTCHERTPSPMLVEQEKSRTIQFQPRSQSNCGGCHRPWCFYNCGLFVSF